MLTSLQPARVAPHIHGHRPAPSQKAFTLFQLGSQGKLSLPRSKSVPSVLTKTQKDLQTTPLDS